MMPNCTYILGESPEDSRDYLFALDKTNVLPSSVDLLPDVYEVEDQLTTSSCTANAACSAMELVHKRYGVPQDFSRMYLYWFIRKIGGVLGDKGAYPRDICKAMVQYGTCVESDWPFDLSKVNVAPPDVATTKVLRYERILLNDRDVALNQIKHAVAQGLPVLLALTVTQSFLKIKTSDWKSPFDGWKPLTGPGNAAIGGHEVLVIGYDDKAERLLCQNSWGKDWGDGGFFGIPYTTLDLTTIVNEVWVVTEYAVKTSPVEGYTPSVTPEPSKPEPEPVEPETPSEPVIPSPEPPKPEPVKPEPVTPPPVHPEREANDSQKRDVFFIGLIILLVVVAKLLKLW